MTHIDRLTESRQRHVAAKARPFSCSFLATALGVERRTDRQIDHRIPAAICCISLHSKSNRHLSLQHASSFSVWQRITHYREATVSAAMLFETPLAAKSHTFAHDASSWSSRIQELGKGCDILQLSERLPHRELPTAHFEIEVDATEIIRNSEFSLQ